MENVDFQVRKILSSATLKKNIFKELFKLMSGLQKNQIINVLVKHLLIIISIRILILF